MKLTLDISSRIKLYQSYNVTCDSFLPAQCKLHLRVCCSIISSWLLAFISFTLLITPKRYAKIIQRLNNFSLLLLCHVRCNKSYYLKLLGVFAFLVLVRRWYKWMSSWNYCWLIHKNSWVMTWKTLNCFFLLILSILFSLLFNVMDGKNNFTFVISVKFYMAGRHLIPSNWLVLKNHTGVGSIFFLSRPQALS